MIDKLDAIAARLDEVQARLSAPGLYDDPAAAAKLLKEQRRLAPIVQAIHARADALRTIEDAQELLRDPEMRDFAQEELTQAQARAAELEEELKILLLPATPTTIKILSSKSAAVRAAKNRRCSPTRCTVCIPCMPKNAAGAPMCCPSTPPNWAAARKSCSKSLVMACIPA